MSPKIILKMIAYALFRYLDRLAQILVPVDPQRFCYGSYPEYSDNAYYIYRHALLTRDNTTHVWLLRSDLSQGPRIEREFAELCRASGHLNNRLIVAKRRSVRGYFLFLRSYAAFHTHGFYPFSNVAIRRCNVSLWHGMPIKLIERLDLENPDPFPAFGSLHCATSHFFKFSMAASFGVRPDQVLISGMPRCDALLYPEARSYSKAELYKKMGVSKSQRLVVWMPTFRVEVEEGSSTSANSRSFIDDLAPAVLDHINRAAQEANCMVVVKLHGLDVLNMRDFSFTQEHLILLRANEWLSLDIPLYELLAASDGLISDVSSVLIDYLVTSKPIGVVGFDERTYSRGVTFPVTWLTRSSAVCQLDSSAGIERFFAAIAANHVVELPDNDVAMIFNAPQVEPGSESVLKAIGR